MRPKTPRARDEVEPHDFCSGGETHYCLATALRYDAVGGRLRQEVHHGPYSAADSACGPFALGPGGITASGGRHGDRPSHPAPPSRNIMSTKRSNAASNGRSGSRSQRATYTCRVPGRQFVAAQDRSRFQIRRLTFYRLWVDDNIRRQQRWWHNRWDG